MGSRADAFALWTRALCAGSFAFFLGVAGHTMADGRLPGATALTALFAFSVLVSLPLLVRRASGLRLVALMVGGQTAIHLCLTVTAGHRGDPARTATALAYPSGATALPTLDGRRVGSLADAYAGTADLAPATPTLPLAHLVSDLQAHAPMMAAHLAAAALVGLWLAHGERLLWTLLALTGRRLVALLRPVVPVLVPAASSAAYLTDRAPTGPRSRWLTLPRSRRGPPLLA